MRTLLKQNLTFPLIIAGMVCIVTGLGLFTFVYARGDSYLSDDPNACVNCHVMRDQFDAWRHSSHARVAACNDCHTPHDSFINKWIVKGINGFNHSVAFTFDLYDEVIHIRDFNADIVLHNCIACHETAVSIIAPYHADAPNCMTCHAGIGHRTRK